MSSLIKINQLFNQFLRIEWLVQRCEPTGRNLLQDAESCFTKTTTFNLTKPKATNIEVMLCVLIGS